MTEKKTSRPQAPLGAMEEAADARDRDAEARDALADARDERADARDDRAEARDRGKASHSVTGAASDRREAKRDRGGSGGDRQDSGVDREASAEDRQRASAERAELLIDGLTGAHRREAGMLELERSVMEAHRTGKGYVLAFIDVDGLRALNNSLGHAAGDQLLRQVVDTVRGVVREYDLIVRYGGDEFLCGLAGLRLPEATRRFEVANASLAVTQEAAVTVGLAELTPGESLDQLIARADSEMYATRGQRSQE